MHDIPTPAGDLQRTHGSARAARLVWVLAVVGVVVGGFTLATLHLVLDRMRVERSALFARQNETAQAARGLEHALRAGRAEVDALMRGAALDAERVQWIDDAPRYAAQLGVMSSDHVTARRVEYVRAALEFLADTRARTLAHVEERECSEAFPWSAEHERLTRLLAWSFADLESARDSLQDTMHERMRDHTLAAEEELERARIEITVASAFGAVVFLVLALLFSRAIRAQIAEVERANAALDRAMVEAQAASRAKTEFLTNMSHELRTPMNGVIGAASLLCDTGADGEQRRLIETVRASSEELVSLLSDILDYSRLEGEGGALDTSEFDLRAALENVLGGVSLRCAAKGLDFQCEAEPGLPLRVRGDSARLRQVVGNVAGNAVKFTERGSVRVRVAFERERELVLEIADTGIGIPFDARERLFKPFSQVDGSLTRRHGGAGMGLAIAKRWVDLMGGAIACESEVGRGTTFTIRVPLERAFDVDAVAAALPKRATTAEREATQPPRVLLVEDNAVNQLVARRMLEKLGARVEIAEHGAVALDKLARERFDLVLMDCQMPVMDGYRATRLLREREGDARHTPVVALTAHALAGDRQACLDSGMDDYMTKPLRLEQLEQTLLRYATRGAAAV